MGGWVGVGWGVGWGWGWWWGGGGRAAALHEGPPPRAPRVPARAPSARVPRLFDLACCPSLPHPPTPVRQPPTSAAYPSICLSCSPSCLPPRSSAVQQRAAHVKPREQARRCGGLAHAGQQGSAVHRRPTTSAAARVARPAPKRAGHSPRRPVYRHQTQHPPLARPTPTRSHVPSCLTCRLSSAPGRTSPLKFSWAE